MTRTLLVSFWRGVDIRCDLFCFWLLFLLGFCFDFAISSSRGSLSLHHIKSAHALRICMGVKRTILFVVFAALAATPANRFASFLADDGCNYNEHHEHSCQAQE